MPVVVLFLIFVALLVIMCSGIDYPWNHICASVGV